MDGPPVRDRRETTAGLTLGMPSATLVAMDPSRTPWEDVAELLRTQRQMARLSLRHLAKMTHVSDSYLSQVERGLYEPSPEVLKAIAARSNLPVSSLYERLGWLDDERDHDEEDSVPGVEEAIEADEALRRSEAGPAGDVPDARRIGLTPRDTSHAQIAPSDPRRSYCCAGDRRGMREAGALDIPSDCVAY